MKLPLDRSTAPRLALILALAFGAVAATGCGDDKKSGGGTFDVSGKVDTFAGPTPLIARLSASSKHAEGDVIYRWRFDDGTSSTQPEVRHTFSKAGYYQVILDARDEKGNNDRETFLFGAWPQGQWNKAQTTPLTKKGALQAQRVQQRRTDQRRKALREELRRRAREQIEG